MDGWILLRSLVLLEHLAVLIMKEVRGEAPMSIPQPDLFTNPNDL